MERNLSTRILYIFKSYRRKACFCPRRDLQLEPPVDWCARCGGEIYDPDEGNVCRRCVSEIRRYDADTIIAILEAVDEENAKWASEDVCTTIHNNLALRFPIYEEV